MKLAAEIKPDAILRDLKELGVRPVEDQAPIGGKVWEVFAFTLNPPQSVNLGRAEFPSTTRSAGKIVEFVNTQMIEESVYIARRQVGAAPSEAQAEPTSAKASPPDEGSGSPQAPSIS